MAVNIGPRIQIDGEAEYRRQLQNIIQAQKTLNSEMDKTVSGFDKNASAQSKAKQKSEILKKEVQNQEERVRQLRDALGECTAKYGEADTRTLKWKQALNEAQTELNRLNGELRNNSAVKAFGEDMEAAGQKISSIGDSITSIGDKLTSTVTTPIVAAGTAATKVAMDFETSFAKFQTIADDGTASMSELSDKMMDLSQDTGVAAADIAEAAYQAVSAGQSTADAVDFVAQAINLSKAGFTDVTTATDTLTTIMNAYGTSAGTAASISDKLMTVQNKGKTTVAELGAAIGTVIPTASMYSVNLDQVSAAYITMTKNGIKTSEATTYLNSMINEMGKTGSTTSDILKDKTGKSFQELMESGYNLTDCLQIIQDEAEASGQSMGDMFGNQRAGKAAASMIQHVDDFTAGLDSLANSAGATDKACAILADTTQAKLNKSINNLKNVGVEVGSEILPTVADVAERAGDVLKKAAKKFDSLTDSQKDMVIQVAAAAAAFGPLVSVTGKAVTGVGNMTSAMGRLLQTGLSPVNIAILGVTAAVTGLTAAYFASGGESQFYTEEQWAIKQSVSKVSEEVKKAAENVDALTDTIRESATSISGTGSDLDYYKSKLQECYDSNGNLKEGMEETAEYMLGKLNEAMGTDYSTEFVANAEDSVAALNEIYDAVDDTVQKMKAAALESAFSSQWADAITNQAEAETALRDATAAYYDAAQAAADATNEYNDSLSSGDDSKIQAARENMDRMKTAADEAGDAMAEAAGKYGEASSDVNQLDSAMSDLANGDINSAIDRYSEMADVADEAGQTIKNSTKKAIDDATTGFGKFGKTKVTAPEINTDKFVKTCKATAGRSLEDMQSQFDGNPFNGYLNKIIGDTETANSSKDKMQSVLNLGNTLVVNKNKGADGQADSAKNSGQSVLNTGNTLVTNKNSGSTTQAWNALNSANSVFVANGLSLRISKQTGAPQAAWDGVNTADRICKNNPVSIRFKAFAKGLIQSVKAQVQASYANGGVITKEHIALVGEGNKKEVVVPVEGNRARGLELLNTAAEMLGVMPQYQALPSASGGSVSNNTANYGGVNINVYAAQGQSEQAIASAVMDQLNARLRIVGAGA